MTLDE